jgi:cell division protein FtsB
VKLERGQILGLVITGLMVWLGASTLFGETGLMNWAQRRRERERGGEDTMRLARETHELEGAIARLASGDGLEAVAREQLGLVRPNEIVYRFRRPPSVVTR